MPYPDYYYYHQETSEQHYTTVETGLLDPTRLINNEPFWIADTSSSDKQLPKTILLHNRFFPNIEKKYIQGEKLRQLIADGFVIYFPDKAGFTPLTTENLDYYFSTLKEFDATDDETVISNAIKALNIPQKQMLCLNYFEMRRLISNEPEATTELAASDIKNCHTDPMLLKAMGANDICIDILDPPLWFIGELLWTVKLYQGDEFIKPYELHAELSENRRFWLYSLDLNHTIKKELIDGNYLRNERSQLIYLHYPLTQSEMLKKKRAIFNAATTNIPATFKTNMTALSELESYKITMNMALLEQFDKEIDIHGKNPNQFEELTLDITDNNQTAFESLINYASEYGNLKRLVINTFTPSPPGTLNLSRLESLTIPTDIGRYIKEAHDFFQQAYGLKELNLGGYQAPLMAIFQLSQLKQLQSVTLSDETFTELDFKQLCINAPKLSKCKLSKLQWHDKSPPFDDLDLSRLTTLSLSGTFSFLTLKQLCAKAPHLSHLEIDCQAEWTDDANVLEKDWSFAHVTDLTIGQFKVSPGKVGIFLDNIISSCPSLTHLTISNEQDLSHEVFYVTKTLENLRKLAINCPYITNDSLLALISASPNIENLEIQYKDIQKLPTVSLPKLKSLMLMSCDQHSLQSLLSDAHQITFLVINLLTEVNEKPLTQTSLPHLTEIRIINTLPDPNGTMLLSLIKSTPNLRRFVMDTSQEIKAKTKEIRSELIKRLNKLEEFDEKDLSEDQDTIPPSFSTNKKSLSFFNSLFSGKSHTTPRLEKSIKKQSLQNPVKKMDADTAFKNSTFHCSRIFYGQQTFPYIWKNPPINMYRLQIYDILEINPNVCTQNDVFLLKSTPDAQLSPLATEPRLSHTDLFAAFKTRKEKNAQFFYGSHKLEINDTWQAIASLSANEILTDFHTFPETPIEWMKSKRDGLIYVRQPPGNQQNVSIQLSFILKIPVVKATLSEDIKKIIQRYQQFGVGDLSLPNKRCTGTAYADAIDEKKVGACRHRAIVCFRALKKQFPDLAVRINTNDCHAFIEVFDGHNWINFDLGGYPATLKIDDANKPGHYPDILKKAEINVLPQQDVLPQQSEAEPIENYAFEKPYPDILKKAEINVSAQQNVLPQQSEAEPIENYAFEKPLGDFFKTYYFKTHDQPAAKKPGLQAYLRSITKDFGCKRLITISNPAERVALIAHLRKQAESIQRPVFYVESPSDLVCASRYIKREGDKGYVTSGPGGPLHEFLTQHTDKANPPIIIVNYDSFKANDIVRLNSLLDANHHRNVDGTPLSAEAMVIGVMNPKAPGAYQGPDFYSRIDPHKITSCPFSQEQLEKELPEIPKTREQDDPTDSYVIELFNSPQWKEQLLGHWIMSDNQLIFKEGLLHNALLQHKPIVLKNAPWNDPDFCLFWTMTKLNYQKKNHKALIDYQQNGYDWDMLSQICIQQSEEPQTTEEHPLNTLLLPSFFHHYSVKNQEKNIYYQAGLLENYADKTCHIYVTHPLTKDQWAKLLTDCKAHRVKLALRCAKGVALPWLETMPPTATFNAPLNQNTQVMSSNDIDYLLHELHPSKESLVIDVSECGPTDLLDKINGQFDEKQKKFVFEKHKSYLEQALQRGKTIILKGKFSKELLEALTPLLLKRRNDANALGKLILLTNQDAPIAFYPERTERNITADDKRHALEKTHNQLDWMDFSEPFIKLEQRLDYLQRIDCKEGDNLAALSDRNWDGLRSLPRFKETPFSLRQANALAKAFQQQRVDEVDTILKTESFVFLAGTTGVGKSSFMHMRWPSKKNLFVGINALDSWIKADSRGQQRILFIDEANIGSHDWSMFEGLRNKPPTIFYKNKVWKIGPNHKVVFAGNPLHFGGERKVPALFEKYGHTCVFKPLPAEFLYTHVLEPLFEKSDLNTDEISEYFLSIYQWVRNLNHQTELISPRELSSMALFTLAYCKAHPEADPREVACFYAHQIAMNVIPSDLDKSAFLAHFPKTTFVPKTSFTNDKSFLVTPSRLDTIQRIEAFLTTRSFKQNHAVNLHSQIAGLISFILEGPPGVGKSELIMRVLNHHGFVRGSMDAPSQHHNTYYYMPANLGYNEKIAMLIKAFHEGAIVVIDEINSVAMMEAFLNNLQMGKGPNGENPTKPGFLIMGTRNPITMDGRRADTNAEARRAMTCQVSEYPNHELHEILLNKKIPKYQASALVYGYEKAKEEAQANPTEPKPVDRDLFKCAENVILVNKAVTKVQRWFKKHTPFFELALPDNKKKQQENHDLLIKKSMFSSEARPTKSLNEKVVETKKSWFKWPSSQ